MQKKSTVLIAMVLILSMVFSNCVWAAEVGDKGENLVNDIEINSSLDMTGTEYVVCVPESTSDSSVKIIEKTDSEEIIADNSVTLYQANLSTKEVKTITNLDEDVVVEKNIPFRATAMDLCATDEQVPELEPENPDWNRDMIAAVKNVDGEDVVKIAVVDSGIDGLSDISIAGSVNLVEDEQYLTEYMEDMTGHGTAVASIIQSIDPTAELYSVRVLDENNVGDLQRLVRGIYWCIDNDIDVINMSLGASCDSTILQNAIRMAEESGIVIVASAGNSGEDGVEYPAAYDEVIAVGAVDNSAQKTESSSVGAEVDVVAPGKNI